MLPRMQVAGGYPCRGIFGVVSLGKSSPPVSPMVSSPPQFQEVFSGWVGF